MKKPVVLLLAMCLANSAMAIFDPQPNSMGFYADLNADIVEASGSVATPIAVHVIVVNPTFDQLYGVEFGYTLSGGLVMDVDWASSALDFGTTGNHFVGFGVPVPATPATLVGTINIQPTGPLSMTLTGSDPSSVGDPLIPALVDESENVLPADDSTGVGNVNFTYNNYIGIIVDRPELSDSQLTPLEGFVGDSFAWNVVWTDPNSFPPTSATLRLIDPQGALTIHDLTTTDVDASDGAVYSTSLDLSEVGTYSYYYFFEDHWGQVLVLRDGELPISGPRVSERVNQPPVLSDVVVDPPSGAPGSEFHFSINYLDQENDFPLLVAMLQVVNPVTGGTAMYPLGTDDTDCTDGAVYSASAVLSDPGTYPISYIFLNTAMQTVYMPADPSTYLAGPMVVESSATDGSLPLATRLLGAYPNPFNPQTRIAFELSRQEAVTLRVFDVAGRMVKTLMDGEVYESGRHEETWTGRDDSGLQCASGTYFYHLEAGTFSETKRMVLLK